MSHIKHILLLILLIIFQSSCKKELNGSAENLTLSESSTPFTDICAKYMGMAIEYEAEKKGLSVNIHALSIDEKIERILSIDEEKNNTPSILSFDGDDNVNIKETKEDSIYYHDLYNKLILELNRHPEIIKRIRLSQELYGKQDAMNMMIEQGGKLISKMSILQELEKSTLKKEGPNKLARYTAHAKWPGRVKYRRGKKVTTQMFSQLQLAMSEWSAATNSKLTFLEIKNSGWNQFTWATGTYYHLYVDITNNKDISGQASLGYVPWSVLQIKNNVSLSTCLHELGHTLGLIHEHEREDRDNYINVYKDNVMTGYKDQFNKSPFQRTYGSFDFNSIMIYSSYAFAKGNLPTMRKKDGTTFPANYVLSTLDKAKIKEIYN
jgi:hypothetical protein